MDCFDLLRRQHDDQRRLCHELLTAPREARQRVLRCLDLEVFGHRLIEERYLDAEVVRRIGVPLTALRIADATEVSSLLDVLGTSDCGSPDWERIAHRLVETLHDRLDAEEDVLHPIARRVFGADGCRELTIALERHGGLSQPRATLPSRR